MYFQLQQKLNELGLGERLKEDGVFGDHVFNEKEGDWILFVQSSIAFLFFGKDYMRNENTINDFNNSHCYISDANKSLATQLIDVKKSFNSLSIELSNDLEKNKKPREKQ